VYKDLTEIMSEQNIYVIVAIRSCLVGIRSCLVDFSKLRCYLDIIMVNEETLFLQGLEDLFFQLMTKLKVSLSRRYMEADHDFTLIILVNYISSNLTIQKMFFTYKSS